MPPNFQTLFEWLKKMFFAALLGVVLAIFGAVMGATGFFGTLLIILGVACILPLFVFSYVLTILHWKHRYIGRHSTLWGVLLLVETSGWFKLIYIFRHIIPDMKSSGRYLKAAH